MSTYELNQGWRFGGEYRDGAADPGFDDSGFCRVTLPHTVVPLSWGGWDPASWEKAWIYRRHLDGPPIGRGRVFARFDGIMTSATALLNGTPAGRHQGGYLPWSVELTDHLVPGDNVLAVIVDARWQSVPPGGARRGARSVDYLQPGGIYRDATLHVLPDIFLSDVFARPAEVLDASRHVEVRCTVNAASVPAGPVTVTAELLDGSRSLASASRTMEITAADVASAAAVAELNLGGIGDVTLWSPDTPKLYTVRATVSGPPSRSEAVQVTTGPVATGPVTAGPVTAGPVTTGPVTTGPVSHTVNVRTGFREARFEPDGFFLNGKRLQIFGLNRHQLFPYTGMAMGARLQRRDAEILRRDLNCNFVRCSHYPPSPHFLDACDELGLMVWEEPPGWQYVGDTAWQDLAVQNVRDMVTRDRSRPSVVVWATRLNETSSHRRLYARSRQAARELDGSRQSSGAMSTHSAVGWAEDVFGYDDYSSARFRRGLRPPRAGVPYLVSEAVGALAGPPAYRWTDAAAVLAAQAFLHAQVHDIARSDTRYAGLIGWAGIDYASLNGGDRIWNSLKTAGVLDVFRVPKPGAAFYRSQVSASVRPVILPVFFWDFGPGSPPGGPGAAAMIATNCERLEFYVGGQHYATGMPDDRMFKNLDFPPVIVDLTVDDGDLPELRIDGFAGGRLAASVHMSADRSLDRLALTADHEAIEADGTDSTRITFLAVDAYGNQRPHATGDVSLSLTGPAVLTGDNPFSFTTYGGVGGAFIRSVPGQTGLVTVTASHPQLGRSSVGLTVIPPAPDREFAR